MVMYFSTLTSAPRRLPCLSSMRNIVVCSSQHKDMHPPKDIIEGGNFVIKKTYTIHGPSFVMVRRATDPPARRPQRRSSSLIPYQRAPPSLSSNLHVSDLLRQPLDITKFSVLVDDDVVLEIPDDAVEVLGEDDDVLGSECTGIVWVGSSDNTAQQVLLSCVAAMHHHRCQQPTDHRWSEDHDPSPRRTSRLHFTCNICGHRNEKLVNPRAWHEGTVFARCDGCSIVHKLKDNLNLIDEIVYSRDEEQQPVDDDVEDAYAQGLPRAPFLVEDLVVPPGLVVEPEDPLCN